ncbi:hypothetical protein ACWPKO_26740 (plasmid) [Coraliomargarita sp. W4R53]
MNTEEQVPLHSALKNSSPRRARHLGVLVLGVFALGLLASCSSETDEPPTVDAPTEETAAVAEPDVPAEEAPTTDVIRYNVGDSFTMGDAFFGFFDVTYVGIADIGVLDDGGADELNCYAVLVEATLQEMPADNPDPELGGVTHDVLDANGDIASPNYSAGCSDGTLAENGYPIKFYVEWVAGDATSTTLEKLTIAPADLDLADSVDIDSSGSFVLDFEVVETW